MKHRVLFVAVACVIAFQAAAQEKGFGLGIILGEPTGISAKYWVGPRNAVDGALAWSFRHNGYFNVHADYLWHIPLKIESVERLNFYVGIGGRLGFGSGSTVVGARVPVGLVYWPSGIPIDVFLEVAPILDLAPATEFTANGGVGVRFFF